MKKLEQKFIFSNGWLDILQTFWENLDGKIGNILTMKNSGNKKGDAVFILPIDNEGNVIYMREFVFGTERYEYRIPAGGDDFDNPEKTAEKELVEEIGCSSSKLIYLGTFSTHKYITGVTHLYIALGCRKTGAQSLETLEDIEVFCTSIVDFDRMISENQITCPMSTLTFLAAKEKTNNFTQFDL